jgi:hypothetical protein
MVSRLQGLGNDAFLPQLKRDGMQFASTIRCIHPITPKESSVPAISLRL